MNREIKFKGLSKKTGKWVYGILLFIEYGQEDQRGAYAAIATELEHNPTTGFLVNETEEVMPETVGQFTGLKDNNGKDVYEDDIYFEEVEEDDVDGVILYTVTWIKERSSFAFLTLMDGERKDYDDNGIDAIRESFQGFHYEISEEDISKMNYKGTIHENKELLS